MVAQPAVRIRRHTVVIGRKLVGAALAVAAVAFVVKKIVDKRRTAKKTVMYYQPQCNYQPQENCRQFR